MILLKSALSNLNTAFDAVGEALQSEEPEIWSKVCGYFDEDEHLATQWLTTKIPSLGNKRPCDLILTSDEERQQVIILIDRLVQGDI